LADSVCILRGGKILVHGQVDELLASVKRVRAVLTDGHLPRWVPDETVYQRINRREWLLTSSGGISPARKTRDIAFARVLGSLTATPRTRPSCRSGTADRRGRRRG
jgi:hypothetical protein